MARVEMSSDWREHVDAAWTELATDKLGPAIERDARRYCVVKTGALQDSIENHMDGEELIISATGGDDGETYAVYVEMGTRPHVIRSHGDYPLRNRETGQVFGPVVHHPGSRPYPFLRPALYTFRGE